MAEKLNSSESATVRIAVTIATLLVVLRHGFNLHRFYPDGWQGMRVCDFNVFCQCFLSELTALAIPAFFFISGMLFFLNTNNLMDILAKWKRRLKSLLLPFICWNTIIIIIVIALSFFPVLRRQLVTTYSFSMDWQWILSRLSKKPIVGQFWYIRTLILLCMFTPLCLWIYKNTITGICTLSILFFFWMPVDCGILSSEGVFCFFLGGLVGYRGWHKTIFVQHNKWWLLTIVVTVNILLSIFHCHWNMISWHVRIILSVYLLFQFSVFTLNISRLSSFVIWCGKHAFFIYALHALLLSILELFLAKTLPHNAWCSFCCYWGCIAVTICISIGISWLLRKHFPKLASLLNGYR